VQDFQPVNQEAGIHINFEQIHTRYFSKYAFVHINKTGGVSIETALGLPIQSHKTVKEYVAIMGLRRWRRIFTFAFVRNPWDRVVSHYHHRVKTNQTNLGTNPIGFKKWVCLTYGEQFPEYYDQPKYFMSQVDWLTDESGKSAVNFIGKFETIEPDFKQVCRRLGVNRELPHLNRSQRVGYPEYYDPETIEIVRRWFQRDIELFGYRYDQ